eukprot:GHVN01073310.1.p1 GENE.GHVN01073310.1~~GHVN01073310.1.p1  ORF type:complete len:289 (+),score=33.62 GHVN01073310.1:2782-3648(+)
MDPQATDSIQPMRKELFGELTNRSSSDLHSPEESESVSESPVPKWGHPTPEPQIVPPPPLGRPRLSKEVMYQYHPFQPPNPTGYGPTPSLWPVPLTAPQIQMLQHQHPLMMAMMQNSYPTLAAQHSLLAAQRPQGAGMLPLFPPCLRGRAPPMHMAVGMPVEPRFQKSKNPLNKKPSDNDYLVFRVQSDEEGGDRSVHHRGTDVRGHRPHRSYSRHRSGHRRGNCPRSHRRERESFTSGSFLSEVDSFTSADPIKEAIDNLRNKVSVCCSCKMAYEQFVGRGCFCKGA